MKAFILSAVVLLGACTGNPSMGEPESPGGSQAIPQDPQPVTAERIQALEAEARGLASTDGCSEPVGCRTAPMGERPCGGPRDYLVYCATTTDTIALFRVLEQLRLAEQERNREQGMVSTCEFRSPPRVELVGSTCQAQNSGLYIPLTDTATGG